MCVHHETCRHVQTLTVFQDNINLKEEQSRLSVSYASILEAFQDLKKVRLILADML